MLGDAPSTRAGRHHNNKQLAVCVMCLFTLIMKWLYFPQLLFEDRGGGTGVINNELESGWFLLRDYIYLGQTDGYNSQTSAFGRSPV